MTSNLSSHTEEHFEFVDYTSVSNFERLIACIEDAVSSWGLKDGRYGLDDSIQQETLLFNDEVYELCYSINSNREETKVEMPLADTILFSENYALHQWTGLKRLLVLKPTQQSLKTKLFLSQRPTIELYQAKNLTSACAIAFQNMGCRVPVFVPVGQARYNLYIGYMLTTQQPKDALNETEVRFNMSLTVPTTNTMANINNLKDAFIQKLGLFREEYGKPAQVDPNTIYFSAVYTYHLKNWFDENWKHWPEEDKTIEKRRSFSDDFETWDEPVKKKQQKHHALAFGSFNDPLRTITLKALFPMSNQQLDQYNMDALTANQWHLECEFAPENQKRAFLSSLVEQVIQSWVTDPSNRDYLAPYDDSNLRDDIDLTESSTGIVRSFLGGNAHSKNTGLSNQVTVIKSERVEDVVNFVFHPVSRRPRQDELPDVIQTQQGISLSSTKKLINRFKSAVPYRSFLWNLLFYSLESISNGKGNQSKHTLIGFLKVVWEETVRQIRWHWENLVPLPDLDPFLYNSSNDKTMGVDLRYNIMHQKISMVNCCIHRMLQNSPGNGKETLKEKKKVGTLFDNVAEERRKVDTFSEFFERFIEGDDSVSFVPVDKNNIFDQGQGDDDNNVDDDDVFYDSVQDVEAVKKKQQKEEPEIISRTSSMHDLNETANPISMTDSFVRLPYASNTNDGDPYSNEAQDDKMAIKDPGAAEGGLQSHPTLKLLKTNEPMQIPVTQEPGFMTEDMILEQAIQFEKLGSSNNATHMRAKLQSAQLFSDMQAFKAANPYASLEDFVRWHSPKDWIDDEDGERLSARMAESSNIWHELWKSSKRIPCERQRPLFNTSAEAEKALHSLESTSVYDFFSIMLPTLGLIVYDTLITHSIVQSIESVSMGMVELENLLVRFPWDNLRQGKITFDEALFKIRDQETMMCHAISLLRKLPKQHDLVNRLLLQRNYKVAEGDERACVFELFKNNERALSEPSYQEFIFYNQGEDLASEGRCLPFKQYAMINDTEIRIMLTETSDALYA